MICVLVLICNDSFVADRRVTPQRKKKLGNDVCVLSCVIVCEIRNVNVNVYCVSVSVCEMICCSMTVMWFVKC